jgi:hypothetical protein
MKRDITVGDTILGQYEVTELGEKTQIYQWVSGFDRQTEQRYNLQILLSSFPTPILNRIFDYFDRIKNIANQNLIVPQKVISTQDFPLVILYNIADTETFRISEQSSIQLLMKSLHEATESVHTLHNKGFVHGRINPNNFVIRKGKVCLQGFGYAPILEIDNTLGFKDIGDFLAPELRQLTDQETNSNLVTPAIDCYAFARTVAYWLPSISTSSWYGRAIDPDPGRRFSRFRDLAKDLEKTLRNLYSPEKEEIEAVAIGDRSDLNPSLESRPKGGIIPKHTIQIQVIPSDAGRVEGEGRYSHGNQAQIEAIAFPDWRFLGWDGDVQPKENSFSVIVEQDLQLIARFEKIPKTSASIEIEILPLEAREFVRISGAGVYPPGISVHIEAWTSSRERWRFLRWQGDVNSTDNPYHLLITGDRKIIAQFDRVPSPSNPARTDSSKRAKIPFLENSQPKPEEKPPEPLPSTSSKRAKIPFLENSQPKPDEKPPEQSPKPSIQLGSAFGAGESESEPSSSNPSP